MYEEILMDLDRKGMIQERSMNISVTFSEEAN
jgi:hypothetical protein